MGASAVTRREVLRQVLPKPARPAVRPQANERGRPRRRVGRSRGYFDEMAANFNGFYFGILEVLFNRIFPRVFAGLETVGLEKVVECVKQHPVVLVPCHRSHFDYLILSYIFHTNYLSPPHIAAGINLSFWPPIFGKGAEAISQFETLLGQQKSQSPQPQFAETYLWLGNLYAQSGKMDLAQQTWSDGLLLFPDDEDLQGKGN